MARPHPEPVEGWPGHPESRRCGVWITRRSLSSGRASRGPGAGDDIAWEIAHSKRSQGALTTRAKKIYPRPSPSMRHFKPGTGATIASRLPAWCTDEEEFSGSGNKHAEPKPTGENRAGDSRAPATLPAELEGSGIRDLRGSAWAWPGYGGRGRGVVGGRNQFGRAAPVYALTLSLAKGARCGKV
jgi:hypothetical protein